MKLSITIPDSRLACLLVNAFEGGINYWCDSALYSEGETRNIVLDADCCIEPKSYNPLYDSIFNGGSVKLHDYEDGKSHILTLSKLKKGVEVLAAKYPKHFGDVLPEGNDDATTGDVLVQCALFGDIIYG